MMIRPNQGVDEIAFGMTRAEVRSLVRTPEPLQKKSDTAVPSDYFVEAGLIVHYDDHERVEAIELARPADAVFQSRSLLGEPYNAVEQWFRSLDPRIQTDGAGLTSFRFGVGVYAPHAAKSPESGVEGVIAFRPGYYG